MRAGVFFGWVGACLLVGALFAQARASAAELVFRAPESCARAEVVREQVGKLVGRRFEAIEGIDFEIAITVQPNGHHALLLRTLPKTADGTPSLPRERTLEGASCTEVSDAASVAMALAIAERDEERARVKARPEPEASVVEPVEPETEPADDATPVHVSVGLGALIESGALPAVALGAQLEAAITYGALRAGLVGAWFAPQSAQLPNDDSGARFDFVLGALVLCGVSPLAPELNLIACAGMELGRLGAEGENVQRMGAGGSLWYAPRVDLDVLYAVTDALGVRLRVGAAVPLARPEFVINRSDLVHQPANLSARLLIGFELRL